MDKFIVTAYLAMPYRGELVDFASDEDVASNVEIAKETAFAIQSHFPQHLELYLPHIDPDLQCLGGRDENGLFIRSDVILAKCCEIVKTKDMFICCGHYISNGMKQELETAKSNNLVIVNFPLQFTDSSFERIAFGIWQVWGKQSL